MSQYNQLSRLVRQATQFARLRTLNPLVGYVGAAIGLWERHGLVEVQELNEFEEALIAAGMELSLAPQTVNVDESLKLAKQRTGGPAGAGGPNVNSPGTPGRPRGTPAAGTAPGPGRPGVGPPVDAGGHAAAAARSLHSGPGGQGPGRRGTRKPRGT